MEELHLLRQVIQRYACTSHADYCEEDNGKLQDVISDPVVTFVWPFAYAYP